MKQIDVVVPVMDEAENVQDLVKRIDTSLKSAGIDYGIVFIDDFSKDNTKDVIQKLSKKYPIKYQLKHGKRGKAFSILQGASISDAEYVAMIDGDLQYPPEAIPEMYALAKTKDQGIVTANRGRNSEKLWRKFVSKISRFVIGNILMGVPCDIQSGLKLFKRKLANYIDPATLTPWSFDISLVDAAKQTGESMGCVSIDFAERAKGKSKITLVSGTYQVVKSAVKAKFGKKRIIKIEEGTFAYKAKKFTTHTDLHITKSAFVTFTPWQKVLIVGAITALLLGLLIATKSTLILFISILSFIYFLDLFFGLFLVLKSLHFPPEIKISDDHLKNIKDGYLPRYTILCPLYREAKVLPTFVENIGKLDYPKDKLEVLLLLEEDDENTIEAAKKLDLPDYFKIAIVPDSQPKTKPKACNYGLKIATGEFIVIYDAEDRPEPTQLKKAYLSFQESKMDVFCLQAKLNYFNPHQNLLTRLFTAEYSLWFDVILPGLQSIETTIPLGGTSNHFRTQALRDLQGWDSFNVTEDADLGIRLFRAGYKTAIFDSVTLEEANSNVKNWIRQRSRWIKGYLQTYLVHNRKSLEFAKTGKGHFFVFQLVSGLRISFMLINPFLWAMTIAYFALYRFVGPQIESLFPPVVFYIAATSAVFGNFLYLYYYMIGAAKRGQWQIIKYIYFVPIYWLLASIGAFVAVYQLIFKPHFWEKTIHGLDLDLSKKDEVKVARFVNFKFGIPLNKDYVSGAFLIFASMVGNVLNFLYNAYLGRKLDLEDFGLIGLVGSFVYITSIPLSALARTVTYKSGYLFGKYQTPVKEYWQKVRGSMAKTSTVLAVVWLILTPILTNVFKSDTYLPFLIFVPVWVMGFVASVDGGFVSGNQLFVISGVAVIGEALAKLIFSVLFVQLGLHEWVYLSIPISMFCSFAIGWLFILNLKSKVVEIEKSEEKFPAKFFASSVANKISTIAFLSLDVVAAKIYLSPEDAGRYAILSLAGKMVYMIGSLLSGFVTPIVSKNEGEGVSSQNTFYKILGATTGMSVLAFLAFGVFGWITAPILFGDKVNSVIQYLPLYTFAILLQTVAVTIVNYHQVKGRHIFSYLGFVFSLVQIAGIAIIHRGIGDIVWAMLLGGAIYLGSMVALNFYHDAVYSILTNLADFLGLFTLVGPKSTENTTGHPRILIFNWRDTKHVWSGGAEVYIHEIAKRLVVKGYKVTIFCGNDRKNPRNEKVEGVQIIRRGGFYTVYLWAFLYYVLKLHKYFDVIIDSENGIPFFTPLYSSKKIFLLIHHVHQEVFRMKLVPPLSWIGQFLEKRIMPMVYKNTEVITVSPSSKADILEHKLTTKEPHIIYNGVDLNKYKPAKKSARPMILYLGRLTPQKSIDVLIRAAKVVLEKVPKVQIVIAGEGQDKKRLMKLAKKLGLADKIEFTGKVSDEEKIKLYQRAWLFVNPSLIEGWGITTIEANACGTPVVASNVAGLRDAVHNPHSGVLVPYGNSEEFAENIVTLLKNNRTRQRMDKDSIEWAKKFEWDNSAGELTKII